MLKQISKNWWNRVVSLWDGLCLLRERGRLLMDKEHDVRLVIVAREHAQTFLVSDFAEFVNLSKCVEQRG